MAQSAIEQIAGITKTDDTPGASFKYNVYADMLPRQGQGGSKVGSTIKYGEREIDTTEGELLDFDAGIRLKKSEAEEIYDDFDNLEEFVWGELASVGVDIDFDANSELIDSNKNKEVVPGNNWDSGSETIGKDLQDAGNKVGQAVNTVIIGRSAGQAMMNAGEVRNTQANYEPSSGSAGLAGWDQVVAYIKSFLGSNVRVYHEGLTNFTLYNSDAAGTGTQTPDWVWDNMVWVGAAAGIHFIEQKYSQGIRGKVYTDEDAKHLDHSLTRTCKTHRYDDGLGCFITPL